jgi:hypothetical protein
MKKTTKAVSFILLLATAHMSTAQLNGDNEVDVAELVAQRIIDVCFDGKVGSLNCPSEDEFLTMVSGVQKERSFKESTRRVAKLEAFKRSLRAPTQEAKGSQPAFSIHDATSRRVSRQQVNSLSTQVTKNLQAPTAILASIIRGTCNLRIGKSLVGATQISEATQAFLAKFQHPDGKLLFGGIINRANSARELSAMGIRYKFLLERTEWLYQGERVSWLEGIDDLIESYLTLVDQQESSPRYI